MRSSSSLAAALGAAAIFAASTTEARSFRVGQVPNGAKRGCETCHSTQGGVVFNPFGSDVRSVLVGGGSTSSKDVDWAQLAGRDSDGDGFTNGQELLDPDGVWRIGDASPVGAPSAPGDSGSTPTGGDCGDGRLSAVETCDGDDLRGETCESQNLGGGALACGADCRLDTSGCTADAADDDDGEAAPEEGGCTTAAVAPRGAAKALAFAVLGLAVTLSRRRRRCPASLG